MVLVDSLQLCTVLNSTQMACPTPPLYKYLPQEYIDKLNEDFTEFVVLEEPGTKGGFRRRRDVGSQSEGDATGWRWLLRAVGESTETFGKHWRLYEAHVTPTPTSK